MPSATTVSSRRVLLECLGGALGTERAARTFLEVALRSSGLAQVPRTEVGVLEFVRNHMLVMLEDELGRQDAGRVVRGILSGLKRTSLKPTTPTTAPPKSKSHRSTAPRDRITTPMPTKRAASAPSRAEHGKPRHALPRVALLVADRLRRAGLARELVLAQFEVVAPETVEEVKGAVDVAVVDLRHPYVDEMLREVLAQGPRTRFVVLEADRWVDLEGRLVPLGVRTFCTTAPTARATTVAKLVKQLVERAPGRRT